MSRPKALYVLNDQMYELLFAPRQRQRIEQLVDVYAPRQSAQVADDNPVVLGEMEILLTGWSGPQLDETFLQAAPNLRLVLFAGGSIKGITGKPFWQRNITICSAWAANAIPVSEYTLSQIIFCLKQGWRKAHDATVNKNFQRDENVVGCYDSTVGIISLGMIGRCVCELLRHFDVSVIAYDPFVDADIAAELGVELCSLEDIFRRSDVVSLHTPWLKETENMIRAHHFESMKHDAAFINTARGAVVAEAEMIDVLTRRPDIQAVLDVTHPEPPEEDSPLHTLPNVFLTPHIAGTMGRECQRVGQYMIDELERYLTDQPLQWQATQEQAARLA